MLMFMLMLIYFGLGYVDLANLDIASGQCVNSSISQNVTFGEQGGVLDSGKSGAIGLSHGIGMMWLVGVFVGGVLAMV